MPVDSISSRVCAQLVAATNIQLSRNMHADMYMTHFPDVSEAGIELHEMRSQKI